MARNLSQHTGSNLGSSECLGERRSFSRGGPGLSNFHFFFMTLNIVKHEVISAHVMHPESDWNPIFTVWVITWTNMSYSVEKNDKVLQQQWRFIVPFAITNCRSALMSVRQHPLRIHSNTSLQPHPSLFFLSLCVPLRALIVEDHR